MKTRITNKVVAFFLAAVMVGLCFQPTYSKADTHKASIVTKRSTGTCNVSVTGIDSATPADDIVLKVTNQSTKKIEYTISPADAAEYSEGIWNTSFTIADVKYAYAKYTVDAYVGTSKYTAGTCDFSIHKDKVSLSVSGANGSASRKFTMTSKEATNDVIVPGLNNKVSVYAWAEKANETTAKEVTTKQVIGNGNLEWTADISKLGKEYGTWKVKLVLTNDNTTAKTTIVTSDYFVAPSQKSFKSTKSKALEAKKSFKVTLSGFKNVYPASKIQFRFFNSVGDVVKTVTAKASSEDTYTATVTLKTLKYNLDLLTIRAILTDTNNTAITLNTQTTVDLRVQKGALSITKSAKKAISTLKLTNAYIPGNIKKVEFALYNNGSSKKKIGTYKATANSSKTKFTATLPNNKAGKYKAKATGYTNWGKKVALDVLSFKLSKSDLGKNGWYYEKYNGKKYKFYYENNEKVQDLTKILKLKKSSASNTNNFYIEVNRAACTVTIYAKDEDTGKYIIPVKTCTVCVGRDTSTKAGTGALTLNSSFTPIGSYSICSNGTAAKYSNKQMVEPDQSICYARWATHIVGNVYFHSIAVGSQSHYALPSYRFNLLGSPASAGCIRMAVADAKWIYDYASVGSSVKIKVGNSKKPGPLGKIKMPTSKVNYDPTDPAVSDSRKKKDYKAKRISGYLTKKGERVGY